MVKSNHYPAITTAHTAVAVMHQDSGQHTTPLSCSSQHAAINKRASAVHFLQHCKALNKPLSQCSPHKGCRRRRTDDQLRQGPAAYSLLATPSAPLPGAAASEGLA
jgi:hypothetical protein